MEKRAKKRTICSAAHGYILDEVFPGLFGSLSDREFAEDFPQMATLTLEQKPWPMRRSYLIRAHMVEAKIKERERRKFALQ